MDAALKNALAQRDVVAAEINALMERHSELKRTLAGLDEWIRAWHEFAGSPLEHTLEEFVSSPSQAASENTYEAEHRARKRATGNPKKEFVAKAAREIIRQVGRPLSRRELFDRLASEGIEIKGVRPEKTLSTMLWRTEGYVQTLPSGGYWLAGEPSPEVEAGTNPAPESGIESTSQPVPDKLSPVGGVSE